MAEADVSRRVLVIGGARSGKTRFAQRQAEAAGRPCVLIATAEPFDDEMRDRIARHVAERGPSWRTIEAPRDLRGALLQAATPDQIVVVDCLTVWLGNLMHADDDVDAACTSLMDTIPSLRGPVIFVSNEVGTGIVPEHRAGRIFRDAQGRLNQRLGAICDTVVFVSAGLPTVLKPASPVDLRL